MSLLKYEARLESKLPKSSTVFYPNSIGSVYLYNDQDYVPIRIPNQYNTRWGGVGRYQFNGVDYVVLAYPGTSNTSTGSSSFMILRLSDLEVRYLPNVNVGSSYTKLITSSGLLAMIENGSIKLNTILRYGFNNESWKSASISSSNYYQLWETPTGIGFIYSSGNPVTYKIYSVNTELSYELIETGTNSFPGGYGGGSVFFSTFYNNKTYIFRAGYIDVITYNSDGTINSITHNTSTIPGNSIPNPCLGISGYRKDNYVYLFDALGYSGTYKYHKVNLNNLSDISINNYILYPSCIYYL